MENPSPTAISSQSSTPTPQLYVPTTPAPGIRGPNGLAPRAGTSRVHTGVAPAIEPPSPPNADTSKIGATMHTNTPTIQQLVKSAQQGAMAALQSRHAPPSGEKTASQQDPDDFYTKLAEVNVTIASQLRKMASEQTPGGDSPGVSRTISPKSTIPEHFSNASIRPGTGKSSTTAKPEPGAAPASLETSHAIGNGKTASSGAAGLPESNASQPAGMPIGGKPKGPTHLVASNEAARNATSKDTYAPREKEMAGLLSQRMNANDTALQTSFVHHDGAKTAEAGAAAKGILQRLKDGGTKAWGKYTSALKGEARVSKSDLKALADVGPTGARIAKREGRKNTAAQAGAIGGTAAAAVGAGAAARAAYKKIKGEEGGEKSASDLSIKTASAQELLLRLQQEIA